MKTSEQKLSEAEGARALAEQEAAALRGAVDELEQRLKLTNVALRDEQQALLAAREKVDLAKQLEARARGDHEAARGGAARGGDEEAARRRGRRRGARAARRVGRGGGAEG